MKLILKQSRGYAIVLVMILIVIASATILLSNNESSMFNKIVGLFSRSKRIEAVANSGMLLAELDLRKITRDSFLADTSSVDIFTDLAAGTPQDAFDQGLHIFDENPDDRTVIPRIQKTDGDHTLEVYYFPEYPPCATTPCVDDQEYNEALPKYFVLVSQATNTKTNEIFTVETRIQVRKENYTEISYGIRGVTDYPINTYADPNMYFFKPSVYGRTHFNIPGIANPSNPSQVSHGNRIRFTNDGNMMSNGDYIGGRRKNLFQGYVTFEDDHRYTSYGNDPMYEQEDSHGDVENEGGVPFQRSYAGYSGVNDGLAMRPIMEFTQGYETGVDLVQEPTDDTYNANYDPTSDAYFDSLEDKADTLGENLASSTTCPTNGPAHVCLKLTGGTVQKYNCNTVPLVDHTNINELNPPEILQPNIDVMSAPGDWQDATVGRDCDGDGVAESANGDFNCDGSLDTVLDLPERYQGERSDVFTTGTYANAVDSFPAQGVFYCSGLSGCDCNVHVKGIYQGSLTIAADNVVIEGDIVNQNQNEFDSPYTFGAIAKKDILIPPGIPQAANSVPNRNTELDHTIDTITANDSPYSTSGTGCLPTSSGCTPDTLAETHLNFTNFIAHDGTNFDDRDTNVDYTESGDLIENPYRINAAWFDYSDTSQTDYYNSPMALDMDGHFFAGNTVKVEGIFNPEVSHDGSQGVGVLSCTDSSCSKYMYAQPCLIGVDCDTGYSSTYMTDNPLWEAKYNADGTPAVDTDGDPIYGFITHPDNYTGGDSFPKVTDDTIQPVFWADGMHKQLLHILTSGTNGPDKIKDLHEAAPRAKNQMLHVFGSLNAKYFFIEAKIRSFDFGFRNKVIMNDPRSSYAIPPGFPTTNFILYDELYRKSYPGKSAML